jgi:hypothetical protein
MLPSTLLSFLRVLGYYARSRAKIRRAVLFARVGHAVDDWHEEEEDNKDNEEQWHFGKICGCSGDEDGGVLTMNHVVLGIVVVVASFWAGWRAGRR